MANMLFTEDLDWCAGICPALATFNRAFVARKGLGLFHIAVLEGDEESVRYCAEQEAKLFADRGIYDTGKPYISASDKRGVYFFRSYMEDRKDWYQEQVKKGSLIFLMKEDSVNTGFNVFHIGDCRLHSLAAKVAEQLGIPETVAEAVLGKYEKCVNISEDIIVNNTILRHYETLVDDEIQESDFEWLENWKNDEKVVPGKEPVPYNKEESGNGAEPVKKDTPAHAVEAPETPKEPPQNTEPMPAATPEEPVNDIQPEKTVSAVPETAPVTSTEPQKTGPDPQPAPSVEPEKPAEPQKTEAEDTPSAEAHAPQETAENGNPVPVPVKTPKAQEIHGLIKEMITKEEDDRNYELLEALKSEYRAVHGYIYSLRNSKWKIIMNRMQDAIDSNDLSQQYCPMYLSISDDITTELYAKLYDLDGKTKQFQESIVRMIVPFGCPHCGKEWKEDVTFLPPGAHFIECPECRGTRGYEKPRIS